MARTDGEQTYEMLPENTDGVINESLIRFGSKGVPVFIFPLNNNKTITCNPELVKTSFLISRIQQIYGKKNFEVRLYLKRRNLFLNSTGRIFFM